MVDTKPWTAALDRAGYSITEPRRAVAEMVAERDSHFTAPELVLEAKRRRLGVGRATVFRALEVFEELGLVERLDLPSGEHAYARQALSPEVRQADLSRTDRGVVASPPPVSRQHGA